jgi:hypothetical protein
MIQHFCAEGPIHNRFIEKCKNDETRTYSGLEILAVSDPGIDHIGPSESQQCFNFGL